MSDIPSQLVCSNGTGDLALDKGQAQEPRAGAGFGCSHFSHGRVLEEGRTHLAELTHACFATWKAKKSTASLENRSFILLSLQMEVTLLTLLMAEKLLEISLPSSPCSGRQNSHSSSRTMPVLKTPLLHQEMRAQQSRASGWDCTFQPKQDEPTYQRKTLLDQHPGGNEIRATNPEKTIELAHGNTSTKGVYKAHPALKTKIVPKLC